MTFTSACQQHFLQLWGKYQGLPQGLPSVCYTSTTPDTCPIWKLQSEFISGWQKSLILYADDIVLYRPIATHSDVESLQADVDKLSNWVRDAGLSLNAKKSKVIVFSRKRAPPVVNILVCYNVIPVVEPTCFLRGSISCDLKWNTHIVW